jgi:hypothetical protein
MAKQIIEWPGGPVDQIVADWFKTNGINSENVRGYVIERDSSGSCWIKVEMWFDPQTRVDVTGIDKSEPEFLERENS